VSARPAPSPLRHLSVEFIGSFPDPAVALTPTLPEFLFLGRSNVGKSSLINALLGRRRLARVSGTPGKTTALNVYRLPECYWLDLPGYGYARAGKVERAGYRSLVERALTERGLAGVVWLLDVRHDPSVDDRTIQELLHRSGRPVLVVLTKADKLRHQARSQRTTALASDLQVPVDQVQLVSCTTGLGIADLGASLSAALGGSP